MAELTPQIPKAHKDGLADDQPQTRSFLTTKSAQGAPETVDRKLTQALEANADELAF